MGRNLSVLGLFVVGFLVGYGMLRSQTDDNSISRDPAAIKGGFDFSHLQGEKLHVAIKQRLLTGLELRKRGEGTAIGLGHFLFLDQRGEKKMACQEFAKVIVIFEAEGMSVGGEKPQMEVEGRCEYSADMARINPLFLPVGKILGERPGDGEFQFHEGTDVSVRFANLPEEWPRTWLLKSVKLVNETGSQALIVESEEVARYLGHPMVFSW